MIVSCEQPAFSSRQRKFTESYSDRARRNQCAMDPIHALNCGTWAPAGSCFGWSLRVGSSQLLPFFAPWEPTKQDLPCILSINLLYRANLENLSFLLQDWMVFALATGVPNFPSAFRTQCLHRDAECIIEGLLLVPSLLLYKTCIFVPIRPFYIHGWVVHLLPCSKEYAKVRHVTAGKFTALLWIFAPYLQTF